MELYKHVPQHKGLFPAGLACSLPGSHLPLSKRCLPAAFWRGGLVPTAVSREGCASVPMETIWRVLKLV